MGEPLDFGEQHKGPLGGRSEHKPNLPTPKVRYLDFVEAQEDGKVKRALREALEENANLEREGKVRL